MRRCETALLTFLPRAARDVVRRPADLLSPGRLEQVSESEIPRQSDFAAVQLGTNGLG